MATLRKFRDEDTGRTFDIISDLEDVSQEEIETAINTFLDTGKAPTDFSIVSARVPKAARKKSFRERIGVPAVEKLLGPLFGTRGIKGKPGVARTVAEFVTPKNKPQAIGELGIIAAAIAFPEPLSTVAGLGTLALRVAAPAVLSSVTSKITGEGDPVSEGFQTGVGALVPEFLGVPTRAALRRTLPRKFGGKAQFIPASKVRAQKAADGNRIVTALKKEIPAFRNLFKKNNADELLSLFERGPRKLSDDFQASDDAIAKAFGDDPIKLQVQADFPQGFRPENFGFEDLAKIEKELTSVQNFSPRGALQKVKDMKAEARRVSSRDPSAGHKLHQKALRVENALKGALQRKSPKLLVKYEKAVTDFRRGTQIVEALQKSGAVSARTSRDPSGATLDMGKLQDFFARRGNDLPTSEFPSLRLAARRGGAFGARDVLQEVNPLRIFSGRSAAVPVGSGINVRTGLSRRILAGEPRPKPALLPGPLQPAADIAGARVLRGDDPRRGDQRSFLRSPF
ncbi:hypothetical protein LCGC14_0474570 [marine sediment metagenome]|uniref:Uncharacterized protein n=1 Tax=marine sediment metagenome TaxID=412755 RepID=A0A0F9SU63_9ZZZZ